LSERSGIGYDSHRLVEGRRLILGGVVIEESQLGLLGHSDGDVLTHAVIDALLGAAGLGDIGLHFPDSDERYADADSIELLTEVNGFLTEHGWGVSHVDVTVICEAPRLGGHRDEMRVSLAEALGLGAREVNVKFSTNEGMGSIGRGEGIAAIAVATVDRARPG
jgi:2-C-methyl-D-erythritol 2,4-cyclodiphosphate synthase